MDKEDQKELDVTANHKDYVSKLEELGEKKMDAKYEEFVKSC